MLLRYLTFPANYSVYSQLQGRQAEINSEKQSSYLNLPVADGDQEVFRRRREELKVCDVQLLDLDGLAELYDEPGRQAHCTMRVAAKTPAGDATAPSASSPDLGAARVQHVNVHVLFENGRCALRGREGAENESHNSGKHQSGGAL